MLNFGKFLHSETSAIGLTSLGLARKIENKTTQSTPTNNISATKQLKQNMSVFSAAQSQNLLNQAAFQSSQNTLNNLFGRGTTLNFTNRKLIG